VKTSRQFLLDANVFIQAYRRYYAFEICPGFWTALVEQHGRGRVFSLRRVRDELDRGTDDLAKWARSELPDICFSKTDDSDTMAAFAEAQRWVDRQPRYLAEAKTEFATVADGWLPAYARSRSLVVVTHELPDAASKKTVMIPDVCNALGVKWIDTFDMLRELGVSFSLTKP